MIRTRVSEIREMSRNTQGVTLIGLDPGEKLVGLQRVEESEDDDIEAVADLDAGADADAESGAADAQDNDTPDPEDNDPPAGGA